MIIPYYSRACLMLDSNATSNSVTVENNMASRVIILVVLLAARFAVLVGYSITRLFFNEGNND